MYVLGISALYHDAAAALIHDGVIIAAAQEERFTRIKHDSSLPVHAMRYCLLEGEISVEDIDAVVYYDNPFLTLDRFINNARRIGSDMKDLLEISLEPLLTQKLWIHKDIQNALGGFWKQDKLYVTKHHIAHAASAFYPSPFDDAVILTIDGVGEYTTTAIGYGKGKNIQLVEEIHYPHSLGLLYSAFTYFCGFKVNYGDYKLMGLAPYGKPKYVALIKEHLIDIKEDGSYRLNMEYFDYIYGRAMTNKRFSELFGGERRDPESRITRREMDMAASVQKVVEEVVIKLARHAKKRFPNIQNLVMAGGVALNCVANGVLQRSGIFENIWIQPAAGDAGGALGAALYYYWRNADERKVDGIHDSQRGSLLGPEFTDTFIQDFLKKKNIPYQLSPEEEIFDEIARYLDEGKVIGLFEGRMEYGPRALGNRSIIGDPRSSKMQSKLNLKIKFRESFRPFAPSVLSERKQKYFDISVESPYMLLCADVKKEIRKNFDVSEAILENSEDLLSVVNMPRSEISAVTHVDYSARLQTVSKEMNPFYYSVIKTFENLTGCGVIINTSFNVRGEPIVCTPSDAYKCFMRTDMDVLVMGHYILLKEQQPLLEENEDWRNQYALD